MSKQSRALVEMQIVEVLNLELKCIYLYTYTGQYNYPARPYLIPYLLDMLCHVLNMQYYMLNIQYYTIPTQYYPLNIKL